MAKLEINVPFESDQAVIVVEVDPAKPLARGRHLFRLEVTDDSGNVSQPDQVVVIVADRDIGKEFRLSGEKSFDIGGSIKSYRFTYLGPQLG
jgi:hypothetical protein